MGTILHRMSVERHRFPLGEEAPVAASEDDGDVFEFRARELSPPFCFLFAEAPSPGRGDRWTRE